MLHRRLPLARLCFALVLACTAHAANAAKWIVDVAQTEALYAVVDSHPDEFAGLSIDEDKQLIVVNRVRAVPLAIIENLLLIAPTTRPVHNSYNDKAAWTIVLVPVQRSMSRLEAVRTRIGSIEPFASLLTPVLASHHIDVERNVVAIGVTGLSRELIVEAQKQFGGDVALFVRKRSRALSRIDSSVDVSAGARLRIRLGGRGIDGKPNPVRASCTSGFAVRSISDHSLHGVLTAGHCFIFIHSEWPGDVADGNNRFIGAGAAWQGKYSQSSTAPFNDLKSMGSPVADTLWPFDTAAGANFTDAALILEKFPGQTFFAKPATYSSGDIATSNFVLPVVGTRTVRQGSRICFSGSITGENCAGVVSALNVEEVLLPGDLSSGNPSLVKINGAIAATSSDGSTLAQGGDSGGPVYVQTFVGFNLAALAVGSISGGDPNSTRVIFMPMAKVIPQGYQLWTQTCGLVSCTPTP